MRASALFFLAGLLEIGAGHPVWLWLRERRRWGVDGRRPDLRDWIGVIICLAAPRS